MASNQSNPGRYVHELGPGMLFLFRGAIWFTALAGLNVIGIVAVLRQFWDGKQILTARIWIIPLVFVLTVTEIAVYETVKGAILRHRQRVAAEREPDYGGWRQLWEGPISDPRADGKPAEPMPDRLEIWDGVVSSVP